MITCPECGRANKEGSKFCIQCGRALAGLVPGPTGGAPRWGDTVVPDWLLDAQALLPEELRDPELEQMARSRHASAGPGGSAPVRGPAGPGSPKQQTERLSSMRDQAQPGGPTGTPAGAKEDADTWLQGLLAATKSTEASPATGAEGE
jgi:hypothetical protein